jgi:hypothetical protein
MNPAQQVEEKDADPKQQPQYFTILLGIVLSISCSLVSLAFFNHHFFMLEVLGAE